MLCDECKKRPAAVHWTKVINNHKIEKHLCEQCAQQSGDINLGELGFSFDNKFSVQDLLKGILGHSFGDTSITQAETACPHCKMTYSDFSRSGKIGCSSCYSIFENRLDPLVRRIHGASGHTGKAPHRTAGKLAMKHEIKQLREELDRLVSREEYEAAAQVRDQIRVLQQNLKDEER